MKTPTQTTQLKFVYDDGSEFSLEIAKFSTLRKDVKQVMMHVDQLPDGKVLLIMNESIMPVGEDRKLKGNLKRIDVIRSSEG